MKNTGGRLAVVALALAVPLTLAGPSADADDNGSDSAAYVFDWDDAAAGLIITLNPIDTNRCSGRLTGSFGPMAAADAPWPGLRRTIWLEPTGEAQCEFRTATAELSGIDLLVHYAEGGDFWSGSNGRCPNFLLCQTPADGPQSFGIGIQQECGLADGWVWSGTYEIPLTRSYAYIKWCWDYSEAQIANDSEHCMAIDPWHNTECYIPPGTEPGPASVVRHIEFGRFEKSESPMEHTFEQTVFGTNYGGYDCPFDVQGTYESEGGFPWFDCQFEEA